MKYSLRRILFSTTLAVSIFVCLFILPVSIASAAQIRIEDLENVEVKSDFVVGPGKTELEIKPGESQTVNITVTNRMGVDKIFNLDVEDFTGSKTTDQTIVLLGTEHGPYSLRDFFSYPQPKIVLKHGQRAVIPVTVTIPKDAQPGGRYGSVIVSTATVKGTTTGTGSSAIVSRVGALFFVKIPGDVKEEGMLKDFSTINNKVFFTSSPIDFQILYENHGSIYLNPYGEINIKNILGKEVGTVEIRPWFALPDSLRLRQVSWDRSLLFGRYTAHLVLNRGYDNIVDTKDVVFYVIPLRVVIPGLIIVVLLILAIRWMVKNVEFGFKRK
jgi:hypothetical protein